MLVAIQGRMGSGKTLTMVAIAKWVSKMTGLPIYANHFIDGAQRINNLDDLWRIDRGILCFDEAWISLDSRLSKQNVEMTEWVNQTRKKGLLVLYTTQHVDQVDKRLRLGSEWILEVVKRPRGIKIYFYDCHLKRVVRRTTLDNPERYYGLYNTYELVGRLV